MGKRGKGGRGRNKPGKGERREEVLSAGRGNEVDWREREKGTRTFKEGITGKKKKTRKRKSRRQEKREGLRLTAASRLHRLSTCC